MLIRKDMHTYFFFLSREIHFHATLIAFNEQVRFPKIVLDRFLSVAFGLNSKLFTHTRHARTRAQIL